MKKLLIINACVHRDSSRTDRLLRAWLRRYAGEYKTEELILEQENIAPLNTETLALRDFLLTAQDFSHQSFHYAAQLRAADAVVIAAPYWDAAFPAALKCWIEAVCVCGLTFRYLPDGTPEGLCRAKQLTYLTTCGGFIGDMNLGYDYVRAIAGLCGISETHCIAAEGLDIVGADVNAILHAAEAQFI